MKRMESKNLDRFTAILLALTSLMACVPTLSVEGTRLAHAEALIDAFYAFDKKALEYHLDYAQASIPSITYYQGWAEGGNYQIISRAPCQIEAQDTVTCAITVRDDPMLALGIDFNVTDTFHISFSNGHISAVRTTSNDLQVYKDAAEWVQSEMPELISEPCEGFFAGGPTPGDCARAMTKGYAKFADREG
jgi:hypothetical protein